MARPVSGFQRYSHLDDYLASISPGSMPAHAASSCADGAPAVSDDIRRLVAAVGELIRRRAARSARPMLVGIGGGPGAGKTTFSQILTGKPTPALSASQTVHLSLEDFYLPTRERIARGYRWRAVPGTHDMDSALRIVSALRSQRSGTISIPRFDMATGEAKPDETVTLPVAVTVVEGWLIGYDKGRYGELTSMLDLLIFLDAELPVLRRGRFQREHEVRTSSRGNAGMSADQMAAFWREALEPGVTRWVEPVRARSDLIVEVDEAHRVLSVSTRACRGAGESR